MSVRPISNNTMLALKRWRGATEVFKETDPNASLLLISAFVEIASNPDEEMTQTELTSKFTGVARPQIWEVVGQMGKDTKPRRKMTPLALVDVHVDPLDARLTRLKLTAKGRNLAMAMLNELKGDR